MLFQLWFQGLRSVTTVTLCLPDSGLNFQELVYLAVQVTLHLPFWGQCTEYLSTFKLPAIGTVLHLLTNVVVCGLQSFMISQNHRKCWDGKDPSGFYQSLKWLLPPSKAAICGTIILYDGAVTGISILFSPRNSVCAGSWNFRFFLPHRTSLSPAFWCGWDAVDASITGIR